jgi:hypothetical protein
MTWSDKTGPRKVKPAAFPDRSPQKRPVPAWIAEPEQQASSLSSWLSSRPGPPPASIVPAPLPARQPSQPPSPAPKPVQAAQAPFPPPLRSASRPPPMVQMGSTDALEAKALSLQQRESMPPRPGAPSALAPLPSDILGERGNESVELAALQARYEARLQEGMAAFEHAVVELSELRTRMLEQAEETIVMLAGALARRVIGREISLDPEIMVTLAVEGTEALGERDRIVVRFGPFEQEEAWQSIFERLRRRVPRCEIVQDPSLLAGQCIVESELGRVDESVDTRLASVLNAILPRPANVGT